MSKTTLEDAIHEANYIRNFSGRSKREECIVLLGDEIKRLETALSLSEKQIREKTERQEKLKIIEDAWNIVGPQPSYHKRAQEKLRREWPTLARALDA